MAYLKVSFSVRWTWSQTSSIVELLLTISASLKSGSTPCLNARDEQGCQQSRSDQKIVTGKEEGSRLPLSVYAHQPQFFPTSFHDVLDAQIKLAAHDDRVGLPRELVEESDGDGVNFVVYIQTRHRLSVDKRKSRKKEHLVRKKIFITLNLPLDVFTVILHDHVDEVIHRRVLITHQHLAVEHLVVAQEIVDHLLVQVLGRCLKCDLHAARLLLLQIDVGRLAIEPDAHRFELCFEQGTLFGSLGGVEDH
jgi:hypothetical protein